MEKLEQDFHRHVEMMKARHQRALYDVAFELQSRFVIRFHRGDSVLISTG